MVKDFRPLIREIVSAGDLRHFLRRTAPESLQGDRLRALDGVPEVVARWAKAVGQPPLDGSKFTCRLPGHAGCRARIWWPDDRGLAVWDCGTKHDGRETWTLAEVWWGLRWSEMQQLGRTLHPRAKRWMLAELGLVELPAVSLPPLDPDASDTDRTALTGIRLWFGVRALADEQGEGVPLVPEFMAPICGLAPAEFKAARRRLRQRGVIRHVGFAGRSKLWVPGSVDLL